MKIEKQIIFKNTLEISLYMYNYFVKIENLSIKIKYPFCLQNVSKVIEDINCIHICKGGPKSIDFPGNNNFFYS